MKAIMLRRYKVTRDSLALLFRTLTTVTSTYRDSNSSANIYVSKSSLPEGVCYGFSIIAGGNLTVFKFRDGVYESVVTHVHTATSYYAAIYYNTSNERYYVDEQAKYGSVVFYHSGAGTGTAVTNGMLRIVTFDEPETTVDALLSGMTLSTLAYSEHTTGQHTVTKALSDCLQHKLVLTDGGGYFEVFQNDTTTFTKISGSSSEGATVSDSAITTAQTTAGTIFAMD